MLECKGGVLVRDRGMEKERDKDRERRTARRSREIRFSLMLKQIKLKVGRQHF